MFVLRPLAKNAIAASRSICAVLWAVVRWLLAPDEDSGVVDAEDVVDDHQGTAPAPPRHCEQCARRGASLSDVAAVVASLGLVVGDDVFFAGGAETGSTQASCGGCAAMAVVDDLLTESKVASEAELREAFYVFDRDEDGFVTPDELWNVMRRLGMLEGGIGYGDCRRMVAAHDGDGRGRGLIRRLGLVRVGRISSMDILSTRRY